MVVESSGNFAKTCQSYLYSFEVLYQEMKVLQLAAGLKEETSRVILCNTVCI